MHSLANLTHPPGHPLRTCRRALRCIVAKPAGDRNRPGLAGRRFIGTASALVGRGDGRSGRRSGFQIGWRSKNANLEKVRYTCDGGRRASARRPWERAMALIVFLTLVLGVIGVLMVLRPMRQPHRLIERLFGVSQAAVRLVWAVMGGDCPGRLPTRHPVRGWGGRRRRWRRG